MIRPHSMADDIRRKFGIRDRWARCFSSTQSADLLTLTIPAVKHLLPPKEINPKPKQAVDFDSDCRLTV